MASTTYGRMVRVGVPLAAVEQCLTIHLIHTATCGDVTVAVTAACASHEAKPSESEALVKKNPNASSGSMGPRHGAPVRAHMRKPTAMELFIAEVKVAAKRRLHINTNTTNDSLPSARSVATPIVSKDRCDAATDTVAQLQWRSQSSAEDAEWEVITKDTDCGVGNVGTMPVSEHCGVQDKFTTVTADAPRYWCMHPRAPVRPTFMVVTGPAQVGKPIHPYTQVLHDIVAFPHCNLRSVASRLSTATSVCIPGCTQPLSCRAVKEAEPLSTGRDRTALLREIAAFSMQSLRSSSTVVSPDVSTAKLSVSFNTSPLVGAMINHRVQRATQPKPTGGARRCPQMYRFMLMDIVRYDQACLDHVVKKVPHNAQVKAYRARYPQRT